MTLWNNRATFTLAHGGSRAKIDRLCKYLTVLNIDSSGYVYSEKDLHVPDLNAPMEQGKGWVLPDEIVIKWRCKADQRAAITTMYAGGYPQEFIDKGETKADMDLVRAEVSVVMKTLTIQTKSR